MGMTSSLPAWRDTYKSLLLENGAVTAPMQCMVFALACEKHALTLKEFVAERKALNILSIEAFAPSIMDTLSDWDHSFATLTKLMHLEDSHMERLIVHHAKNHQPLTQDTYTMFKSVVESWDHASHRIAWYKSLTPEQSQQTIDDAFASRQQHRTYLHMHKKEAIDHCVHNITQASSMPPQFWSQFASRFMDSFSPHDADSQRIARHVLQNAPSTAQKTFVTNYQTRWDNSAGANIDHIAQWVADVIAYQPLYASIALDGVMKKNPAVLQSPVINSSMVVIDYFLEQGIAKVSGSTQVRSVLNAMISGKGNGPLRERAWVKKLAMFGAKPSDLKKMESWTPAMTHAFDYWLASSFEKYASKAPNTVYTHINREIGWEYERRFNIDLRNPKGFQEWRDQCQAKGADPFGALAANKALCDTWEQGCAFYALNATQPQVLLAGINFELFTNDTESPQP